ncbi:hypothetical protein FQA39_LY09517 [Lamprigera yunnana]|nr:hypothetical protein FQA39_LY09517 [Lamprigera yunnana]
MDHIDEKHVDMLKLQFELLKNSYDSSAPYLNGGLMETTGLCTVEVLSSAAKTSQIEILDKRMIKRKDRKNERDEELFMKNLKILETEQGIKDKQLKIVSLELQEKEKDVQHAEEISKLNIKIQMTPLNKITNN